MAPIIDAHGETLVSHSPSVELRGVKIETNFAVTLQKVTKHASVTATVAYLYDADGLFIESQSFVGNDATFSVALDDATAYFILLGSAGGSYQIWRKVGVTYPIGDTNIDWIQGGLINGTDVPGTATVHNNIMNTIVSVTTEVVPDDKDVAISAALTLSTTATEPIINIKIPAGLLTLTATPLAPVIPKTVVISAALTLSLSEQAPTLIVKVSALSLSTSLISLFPDIEIGEPAEQTQGTIGTRTIETNYPYEEGLIAGTTRHFE